MIRNSDLALLCDMMHSQRDYVLPRIENTRSKEHYDQLITQFLGVVINAESFAHANSVLRQRFWRVLNPDQIKFWWLKFENNPSKYDRLAVENTRDILNSINTRFIEGGSKAYDIW